MTNHIKIWIKKKKLFKNKSSKFFKKIEVTQHTSNSKPLALSNSKLNFINTNFSNFKQITYHSIKQQRLEIWNKTQRMLPSELQNIILDEILQPNKIKEILENLSEYLMLD